MATKLFDDFKKINAGQWKDQIIKDLKGAPIEQLFKTNSSGITLKPFYNSEDLQEEKGIVFDNADWDICERVVVFNEKKANEQALNALQNGASGIEFVIGPFFDLNILLKDISIQHIYLQFTTPYNEANIIVGLQNYLSNHHIDPYSMNCCINFDPIADYISSGHWNKGKRADLLSMELYAKSLKPFASFAVHSAIYHNAGADTIYELTCTLAHINEYLNSAKENKSLNEINKVHITVATGTEFFNEIGKLRALKNLIALLFEQYNIEPKLHIHCETSNIYRSEFDAYTNLLRDTIAGMAAVLGGCNSLTVNTFNSANEEPFALRMSRNQQLIFKEESYLNKVADVAAGSYYIETLSEQLASTAWEKFKEIESQGGLIASFENGIIKKNIAAQAQKLVGEYKTGQKVLIGVNKFPNPNDPPAKIKSSQVNVSSGIRSLSLTTELLID